MTKKIFKSILFTALLTMIICLIFTVGVEYKFYGDYQFRALESHSHIISRSLDKGLDIESFADSKERITLIETDGTVIFDNRSDISLMENHSDHIEVIEALKSGSYSDLRFSETVSSSATYYYAKKLSDGQILRLAVTRKSVFTLLIQLIPVFVALTILTSVIAFVLAAIITKKILKPINDFDPENPKAEDCYEELSPLIEKLNHQKNRINNQIAQLTQSKMEFEIISENMSEGLLLTDLNGVILSYNKSIKKFFKPDADLTGKKLTALGNTDTLRQVFESIVNTRHAEILYSQHNRFYEITVNPVLDEVTGPCGAVVLAIDITEKHQNEQFRREFTANVSHELKTPLTSILGFSEILKEGIAAPEDVKGFGADIHRQTKWLISLVNNIIKLSILDEGAIKLEKEELDLKDIATEVAEHLNSIAQSSDIKISVLGDSAKIVANPNLIFEMVYNLCDNSVKYNRKGGYVELLTGNKNGSPFITVRDNGIGIPPEHHARIFERFYRIEKSRTHSKGGTGLGLSIVKHIASVTSGTLSLESAPDKGTTITVSY